MQNRTVLNFTVAGEIQGIVVQWAQENNFRVVEDNGATKRYKKGHGVLVAPMLVEITQNGANVQLEAWIYSNLFVRIFALFMIPEEMNIDSGGFKLALPRNMARAAVNRLLPKIGQPLIQ